MNPIIRARVTKFASEFGFEGPLEKQFEKFVANLYFGRALNSDPELIEEAVIGGGDDGGIDAAGVIINGRLATDPEDIISLESDFGSANSLRVVFIQCKTSSNFDTKLIARFLNSVERVARAGSNGSPGQVEEGLRPVVQMLACAIENIHLFDTPEIPCEIYYVTTSPHKANDAKNEYQVRDAINKITDLQVFSDVEPVFAGKSELQDRITEAQGVKNVRFKFERKIALPTAEGIEQAYIGSLPAVELANLLLNENGKLREGIFNDNVRLYQGSANPVNKQISATLNSDKRRMFPFLNNGLTVVARQVTNIGDSFTISAYQIVNGCQTSNEIAGWLHSVNTILPGKEGQNGGEIAEQVTVPLKLIQTHSPDVLSEITIATNLQTTITETDIQGNQQLAKDVQEYFENSGPAGLRYMRQVGEAEQSVPKTRVVDTLSLNRAFASVVLGDSSTAIGSPKNLNKDDSEVWNGYPVELYYYAAWIVYKVDRMLSSNPKGIRPARYHLAMLTSVLVIPEIVQLFGGKARLAIKNKVGKKVSNMKWQEEVETALTTAEKTVTEYFAATLREKSLVKDDVRSKRVRDELLKLLQN